jgi:alkanesulfonate monooxygenase
LAETAEQIAAVNAAAKAAGRETPPRISVLFRPILGATEEQAWERAERILDTITASGAAKVAREWRDGGPRRTSGASGFSPPRAKATGTTVLCGRRWRPRPEPRAIPPHWSGFRKP